MKKTYAALALATTIAFAPAASAHDELTGTTPNNGATVTSAPSSLELTFAEKPLAVGNQISVKAPDGSTSKATPTVDGSTVSAPFAGHGDGAYTVTRRVVSSDGHPISGSYTFTLKGGTASTAAPSSAASSSGGAASSSPRATATTTFDSPAPSPAAEAHQDADGSAAWSVIAAVAGVVVVVGIGVALIARRRRGL